MPSGRQMIYELSSSVPVNFGILTIRSEKENETTIMSLVLSDAERLRLIHPGA
jgi:hypothetical protein